MDEQSLVWFVHLSYAVNLWFNHTANCEQGN